MRTIPSIPLFCQCDCISVQRIMFQSELHAVGLPAACLVPALPVLTRGSLFGFQVARSKLYGRKRTHTSRPQYVGKSQCLS